MDISHDTGMQTHDIATLGTQSVALESHTRQLGWSCFDDESNKKDGTVSSLL